MVGIRRLLIVLVCLVWAAAAQAQPAQDQAAVTSGPGNIFNGTTTATSTISLGAQACSGCAIYLILQTENDRTASATDTGGTTYASCARDVGPGGTVQILRGTAPATNGGIAVQFTLDIAEGGTDSVIGVWSASGVDTGTACTANVATATGTSTSVVTADVTPATSNNLMVGATRVANRVVSVFDADYTVLFTNNKGQWGYDSQSSATAGSMLITLASSGGWGAVLVNDRGTGGAGCIGGLTLLGAGKCD